MSEIQKLTFQSEVSCLIDPEDIIISRFNIGVSHVEVSYTEGGKRKTSVIIYVPGSHQVEKAIKDEGLLDVLIESGFELREPGCSACLAMNDDKIPSGKYAVSTSNRNFEGRQGPGSRTLLASPLVAAAAAITGKITDPRTLY